MTKQRELILSILHQNMGKHLTADEIYFLAKLKMPSIAMATIYNNLNAMNDAKIIRRTHIDGVADSFDCKVEPHDHLICDECGSVMDISIPSLTSTIEGHIGREINEYNLVVHYICDECRAKRKR